MSRVKIWLKSRPGIKKTVLNAAIHPVRSRPRLWLRLLLPFYAKRGRGSHIYSSVRKDIAPFNRFSLGRKSVIESYSVVNNLVGDVLIGDSTRLGIGNVIIGPVTIGNKVIVAQNVTITGLDHRYSQISTPIMEQGVDTKMVVIADDVWIGANAVITKGVSIGKHSIVAACSLVNRDVPDGVIVAGNPARVVKRYKADTGTWQRE